MYFVVRANTIDTIVLCFNLFSEASTSFSKKYYFE